MKLLPMKSSLTTRALLLGLINATAVLALGLVMMEIAYHRGLVDFLQAPVQERILSTSRSISLDLLENDSESWNRILKREAQGTPFQFALLDNEGKQIAGEHLDLPASVHQFSSNVTSKLTYVPKFESNERPERKYSSGNFFLQRDPSSKMYWAGVHVLMRYMDNDMYGHGTLVWRFSSLWTNSYFFDFWPYVALIGGALLFTMLCWLPAARALLRRVSRLTNATREIAKGNFDVSLPPASEDEIGQLTESVALMSRQIANLVHQQERFVSDAAHELCSPVSRLQIALELFRPAVNQSDQAMGHEASSGPSSRDVYFNDLAEEVEQMSELIQDLLFYSRARNQKLPAKAQDVGIGSTIRTLIDREALSDKEVIVNVPPSLHVRVSESHLRRALANLLRNAHQHAGDFGTVEIAAHQDNDGVHVFVRDQGPGIPEGELRQVFAPFYRVEYARSRHTGGTGLGLAIVQSSIEACGGTVSCRNRRPTGLEVEMILPAS
jgi:two-component system, OmpR family, sensor histidine kinase CpxA